MPICPNCKTSENVVACNEPGSPWPQDYTNPKTGEKGAKHRCKKCNTTFVPTFYENQQINSTIMSH